MSGPQPASRLTDIRNQRKRRRARPDSEPIRSLRDREPPGGHSTSLMADGDRLPRLRRGGSEPKARQHRADEGEQGNAHDAEAGPAFAEPPARQARGRPDRRRRQGRGGGRVFRAREAGDQRQTAAERPGVQPGRPPTAPRRTAEAQPRPSGASTSGAAQRRTLPSPASSRARSLGAEGLACRVLFLSHAA